MKNYRFLFPLLLLLFNLNAFSLSIREQLRHVNPYWVYHPLNDKIMGENRKFTSDRELIQLHLELVEITLRAKQTPVLNAEQKKQRLLLLDVLHEYRVRGLFPTNTGHRVRTPYFIDVFGTACAVGQLMISSGHATEAMKIAQENNNGYVCELVLKYPQIKEWAYANGFALEELAWIQPCYAPPVDTAGLRQPTCHNAINGYFCPDVSQLQPPLTKAFYRLMDTVWVPWSDMCGFWMFSYLRAGKYKWTVKDGGNVTHTFTMELVAPPPATVTIIKSGNFNACNGVITASVQGGVLPFNYFWPNRPETTAVLSSVCEELVKLTFSEGGLKCPQFFDILTSPLGLHSESINSVLFSPNPVADFLKIESYDVLVAEHNVAKVLDLNGNLVLEIELTQDHSTIDVGHLVPGIYFLQMDNLRTKLFVKE